MIVKLITLLCRPLLTQLDQRLSLFLVSPDVIKSKLTRLELLHIRSFGLLIKICTLKFSIDLHVNFSPWDINLGDNIWWQNCVKNYQKRYWIDILILNDSTWNLRILKSKSWWNSRWIKLKKTNWNKETIIQLKDQLFAINEFDRYKRRKKLNFSWLSCCSFRLLNGIFNEIWETIGQFHLQHLSPFIIIFIP